MWLAEEITWFGYIECINRTAQYCTYMHMYTYSYVSHAYHDIEDLEFIRENITKGISCSWTR